MRQGIIHSGSCTLTCMKLRINVKDKGFLSVRDVAIANAYGNKFIIHLDFKMPDSAVPNYQAELGNRMCYEIMFNDYERFIQSTGVKRDSSYKISDISLEYEIVTQPDLASRISTEYQNMALKYDRILRYKQIPVNKSDTTWNWSLNTPC